jgi:hypothetical protein
MLWAARVHRGRCSWTLDTEDLPLALRGGDTPVLFDPTQVHGRKAIAVQQASRIFEGFNIYGTVNPQFPRTVFRIRERDDKDGNVVVVGGGKYIHLESLRFTFGWRVWN